MAQRHAKSTRTDSEEPFPVYLPAMPTLSETKGRIEQFVSSLLRRRGALRPVSREDDR
ncbi:MAG: hypothetical protein ABEH66_03405 [Halobacteriales archaeon]